ncbi:hypothetical protein [Streptomyces sp. NPDC002533]
MQRHASIHLTGPRGTILVDGQDISHCVRGFELTGSVDARPALGLDLLIDEAEVDGKPQVYLPAHVAELLTALGWTPPADYDVAAELHPLPDQRPEGTHTVVQPTEADEALARLVSRAVDEGLRRWGRRARQIVNPQVRGL